MNVPKMVYSGVGGQSKNGIFIPGILGCIACYFYLIFANIALNKFSVIHEFYKQSVTKNVVYKQIIVISI